MHLPELPTHDEVQRMQKRARTVVSLSEVQFQADNNIICRKQTDALSPSFPTSEDTCQLEARSASKRSVICIIHPESSAGLELHHRSGSKQAHDLSEPTQKPQHVPGKPSIHALIRQTAASTAPEVNHCAKNQFSRRHPGLSFFNRLTKMRWKRAMDSTLDTSPMRSMLSHFSPSRFQRVNF